MFAKTIGMPLKFDTLYVGEWKQNLLLADSYGEGRVFIAGDAAHLVIPTGGLGMNSGVGDAIDLSWKLAATLEGWGGPKLLPAYTTERRKVGDLNVQASRYATLGRRKWRSMWKPNIRDDTPEGAASRAELARVADTEQRKSNEMTGAELGYHYFGSPLVAAGGGRGAGLRLRRVHPVDLAGRAAAAYLARRRHGDAGPHRLRPRLYAAAARQVAGGCRPRWRRPLRPTARRSACSTFPTREPRAVYGCDLILLRPDMHVAWRGNRAAGRAGEACARSSTGH